MSDYIPSDDLKQHMRDAAIISYRLVDGSYLLAEEIDADEENNIIYIADALELNVVGSRAYFGLWLDTEEDEMIQLVGDKIIGRAETPLHLKMDYHRYFILQKLKNILTKDEISKVVEEMFNPPVDNHDLTDDYEEGEDWKIDNGISSEESLKPDYGFESTSDYHLNWRKKFKGNN